MHDIIGESVTGYAWVMHDIIGESVTGYAWVMLGSKSCRHLPMTSRCI